jgi:RimJ/RimL family protein N-acetyltransferase
MMIGVVNGAIAAGASVFAVSERMKLRHRAVFGIAIVKEYWHLGLGQLMTAECIRLAREMGFEQLELQVLSGNTRARRMYDQAGFEAWGSVKNGFKLRDGSYQDDVLMGLFLKNAI